MNEDRSTSGDRLVAETKSRDGPLAVDELFTVLARPGNRFVLTYLLLESQPVSIVDLVEYVLEVTEPPDGVARAEYSGRLLGRFVGTVLPELDERGLVEYDRETQLIAETDATALALPYLRAGLEQASPGPERNS